jgi:ATP-binding cassette subfamily B protein
MTVIRRIWLERWALLHLLVETSRPLTIGMGLLFAAVCALPALSGALTALLVRDRLASGSGGAIAPLLVAVGAIAGVLTLELVAAAIITPLQDWFAMLVNGRVRRLARRFVLAGEGRRADERERLVGQLTLDDTWLFNVGAAAVGQLWLIARFVGVVGSFALVASYSWEVAFFELVVMLAQRGLLRRLYAHRWNERTKGTEDSSRAAEYWASLATSPKGASEVRIFGLHDFVRDRYTTHARAFYGVAIGRYRRAFPSHLVVLALSSVGAGVPLLMAGRAGADGALSPAHLAGVLAGIVGLFQIGAMGFEAFSIEGAVPQLPIIATMRAAVVGSERAPAAPPLKRRVCAAAAAPVGIVFDSVTVSYPGGRSVLNELSLRIEPGQSLAIVGENGAGKTTMMRALCGLVEPSGGCIRIGDNALDASTRAAWWDSVGVFFQDAYRFELPVWDNVTLGAPRTPVTLATAERVAADAGILDKITSLPAQWSTVVSPRYDSGADLSGGQWQRLGIARCLFAAHHRDTAAIVLDEPTSNLDIDAELALLDRLFSGHLHQTLIVVSHRYSTVRRADHIVMLHHGTVSEQGSHSELMANGRRYAQLYELQAAGFRAQSEGPAHAEEGDAR